MLPCPSRYRVLNKQDPFLCLLCLFKNIYPLVQMASMDAETTKYLGGDVEHTHLVKGLDYALLVKIREEERQQQLEV